MIRNSFNKPTAINRGLPENNFIKYNRYLKRLTINLHYNRYIKQQKDKTSGEHRDSTKLIIILIYTTVFVLCEGPIWLIYFLYNIEEGIKWMGNDETVC
jgi:hypothetical protein